MIGNYRNNFCFLVVEVDNYFFYFISEKLLVKPVNLVVKLAQHLSALLECKSRGEYDRKHFKRSQLEAVDVTHKQNLVLLDCLQQFLLGLAIQGTFLVYLLDTYPQETLHQHVLFESCEVECLTVDECRLYLRVD